MFGLNCMKSLSANTLADEELIMLSFIFYFSCSDIHLCVYSSWSMDMALGSRYFTGNKK